MIIHLDEAVVSAIKVPKNLLNFFYLPSLTINSSQPTWPADRSFRTVQI